MTLLASINDAVTTRIAIRVPYCGAFDVDGDFDRALSSASLVGAAQVRVGPLTLSGTFDPALTGTYLERSKCHMHGGGAAWDTTIARREYHDDGLGVKAADVIADLAREVGETLAAGGVAPGRERLGTDWVRREGTASTALELAAGGVPWWVDYDGKTHVGPRVAAEVVGAYEILDVDPRFKTVEIACEDPSVIQIGSILRGRLSKPITVRELAIEIADSKVRVLCWGAEGSLAGYMGRSRLLRDLQAVARSAFPEAPYSRIYRYRVVDANPGDHRWELQAVASAQRLPDISPASVHPGVAGMIAELPKGTEVLVEFIEANPALPIVTHFAAPDQPGFIPVSLTLCAGPTGSYPTEHATSAEAVVSLIVQTLLQLGIQNPGPVIGAALAAKVPLVMSAAIPLTATVPITPYASVLAATLAAKLPNATGDLPGPGCPSVRLG